MKQVLTCPICLRTLIEINSTCNLSFFYKVDEIGDILSHVLGKAKIEGNWGDMSDAARIVGRYVP